MKHFSFLSLCTVFLFTSCSLSTPSDPATTSPEPISPVVQTFQDNNVPPIVVNHPIVKDPVNPPTPVPTPDPKPTAQPSLTPIPLVKAYTTSEVARHSTSNDCWLILGNGVYDVTSFIPRHPGGDKILRGCGRDATQMFSQHPESAKAMKEQFKIGELVQ